jgi:hypothetical protein
MHSRFQAQRPSRTKPSADDVRTRIEVLNRLSTSDPHSPARFSEADSRLTGDAWDLEKLRRVTRIQSDVREAAARGMDGVAAIHAAAAARVQPPASARPAAWPPVSPVFADQPPLRRTVPPAYQQQQQNMQLAPQPFVPRPVVQAMQFSGPQGMPFAGPQGVQFAGPQGMPFAGPQGVQFAGPQGVQFSGPQGVQFSGPQGVPQFPGQPFAPAPMHLPAAVPYAAQQEPLPAAAEPLLPPVDVVIAMQASPDNFDDALLALSMFVDARKANAGAHHQRVRIVLLSSGLSQTQTAEIYEAAMPDGAFMEHTDLLVVQEDAISDTLARPELTAIRLALNHAEEQQEARPHVVWMAPSIVALRDPTRDLAARADVSSQICFHPATSGGAFSAEVVLIPAPLIDMAHAWLLGVHQLMRRYPVARGQPLRPLTMLVQMAHRLSPPPAILDSTRYATPATVEACAAADIVLTVPASVA